jgi:hypothetical protein
MERLFEAIGRGVAGSVGGSVGVDIARMTVFAAIAVGLFMIGRQVVRKATGEGVDFLGAAWGWSLLLMMLASPTLFPWYFAWVLPVAWLLPHVPRRTLELACAALAASQLDVLSFRLPPFLRIKLVYGHPLLIVLAVWFVADLWRRLRRNVSLGLEHLPDPSDEPIVLPGSNAVQMSEGAA